MGCQQGAGHTAATQKKAKANIVANPCCGIYTHEKIKQQGRRESESRGKREGKRETERLADPLLAILDRSAVAMATSSPRLVFGAASGITAEDLMFSTHLGSANMVLQSATPLLAPHRTRNPLFGTQRLAPKPPALKSLTECQINYSLHPDRCLCCQCWIGRCKQSVVV